jgi:phospho-N-acetylmuramoyl-pentapeptide-transferase
LAGSYFTVYPARVFLGKISGMAFGATLALVGLLSGKFVPLLIVGGVFLLDSGFAFFRNTPFHQWLENLGWEKPKIVARAWLTGLILAIFGVWLALL